jgi:MbtH protein
MFDDEDGRRYDVVRNDAGQFSVWPADRSVPPGWMPVGVAGSKEDCLAHIDVVWTALRRAD